jgi:hypothetical protein
MGFLDHSTNNIILDAVLTDYGRETLARNDGSFSIFKFAFGDDEIDYGHIVNFGRTVGKEKIEKNTPILEATTQSNLGLKNKLISFNNNALSRLPILSITAGLTDDQVLLDRSGLGGITSQTITMSQVLVTNQTMDPSASDFSYTATLDYNFLRIANAVPDNVDAGGIAKYTIEADATVTSQNLTTCTIALLVRSVSNDSFEASSQDGTYVYRNVTVSGVNSGASTSFQVRIS